MTATKPTLLTVAVLVLLTAALARSGPDRDDLNPLALQLQTDQYRACGLDKLTADEATRLFGLVRPAPAGSYLAESAVRRLERDGWREVDVLGLLEREHEKLLVVVDNYEVVALSPWGLVRDNLPSPGLHWAKNSLSSWDILTADGESVHFTAEEID